MNNISIIIVEDESLLASQIAKILEANGYSIAAIFNEAEDLIDFLKQNSADLLLLDIDLNGAIDGIDLAHEVNSEYHIPFIFLTSNTDKKTLERAKRTHPLSFIAKPYTSQGLISNVEISLHNHYQNTNSPINKNVEESILIKDNHRLIKINYKDIYYVKAMDNYAIVAVEKHNYIIPFTLKKIEQTLADFGFIRVHRSYIVNQQRITEVLPKSIKLNDIQIPMSTSYKSAVLNKFNIF